MIDHMSIRVRDMAAAEAFYVAVLAPLGAKEIMRGGPAVGYGVQSPDFWLEPAGPAGVGDERHIAFTAPSRDAVRAFHEAAVAVGAEVLHEPRLWPEYHATYYGAFVRDPDGNNVEAVCHAAQ